MAEITLNQPTAQTQPQIRISVEALTYFVLIMVALILRVTALDMVPLNNEESQEALAALVRTGSSVTIPDPVIPENALGTLFNIISMTLFGANDAAARLGTALAGTGLTASALLYRRYLGRIPTLLITIGLAISPVALAASRSMSGMVWAMLLVMIGGWAALRFAELRRKNDAILAAICATGILFLTTPFGILILLGLYCGIAYATLIGAQEEEKSALREAISDVVAVFPITEAAIAAAAAAAIIATFFFIDPRGLSSPGLVLQHFVEGLTGSRDAAPRAYGLLTSLRYDFAFVLFGLTGAWFARHENSFFERFLTGWLLWSLFAVTLYPGATADIALLVTLPAIGLTATMTIRTAKNAAYGFWRIPDLLLPIHALIVAFLLVSLAINVRSLSFKLLEEAKIVDYAKVLGLYDANNNAHIGTLKAGVTGSSMAFSVPYTRLENCKSPNDVLPEDAENLVTSQNGLLCEEVADFGLTFGAFPLDDGLKSALITIKNLDGETFYTSTFEEGGTFYFEAPAEGEYRLDILRVQDTPPGNLQYGVLVYAGDMTSKTGLEKITSGAIFMGVPRASLLFRVLTRFPNPGAFIYAITMLLFIPITYFLSGAFYGARAAWRGVALGFLLFMLVYGIGEGWQATAAYGNEPRELWSLNPPAADYHNIQDMVAKMSWRDKGSKFDMPLTVEYQEDLALVWALRNFTRVTYVDGVGITTNTSAVITRDVVPRPVLGADYVGQKFILSYRWNNGSLNWTDFGAWLFSRQSRIEPAASRTYRLWITKEIYDVKNVPEG